MNLDVKIAELTLRELIEALSSIEKSNKGSSSEVILDSKQAAELLGYKISNIYALTHKRLIPFLKKGKKIWFKKDDLLAWVDQGRKLTSAEIRENLPALINKRNSNGR